MNKLYQTEDKIEDCKFLLAALKIESAFIEIMRVFDRKYFLPQSESTTTRLPSCIDSNSIQPSRPSKLARNLSSTYRLSTAE